MTPRRHAELTRRLGHLRPVVRHVTTQLTIGVIAGIPAGLGGWAFLRLLDRVIALRTEHAPWLIWLLPLGGFALVAIYHHLGGRAVRGAGLVIEQVHEPTDGIPRRMAPLILGSTLVAHAFGASVGREGTALQMSASLADHAARVLGIRGIQRRELLVASLAGGFGAVFGVPVAGAVFALEVQTVGRLQFEAVLACFTASFTGNAIVAWLGYHHHLHDAVLARVDTWFALRVGLAAIAFGATAALFVWMAHRIKAAAARISYPPIRGLVGGGIMALAVAVIGRDYTSLSTPLADAALSGAAVASFAWFGKASLTALCLGTGIPGGEVTPLFVTGALLGAALAGPLGLPAATLAALGFVSVFAGASNTPIACTLMFAELFGSGAIVAAGISCAVAYVFSGHQGIYSTQRIAVRKH